MARDNSPKERQKRQLERKLARRASYDRILIVSEGSKTEPNYFKEIRSDYRLHTANIEVRSSELGTAPIQVVRYAKELFENGDRHKRIQARAFEQVYAPESVNLAANNSPIQFFRCFCGQRDRNWRLT